MKSLDRLLPSVIAGSLRTLLGKAVGDFRPAELKQVAVAGLFPFVEDVDADGPPMIHLPAPLDLAVQRTDKQTLAVLPARPEPVPAGAGCNAARSPDARTDDTGAASLADQKLLPVCLSGDDAFKPDRVLAWWRVDQIARWLANPNGQCFLAQPATAWPDGFLLAPEADGRSHVKIAAETGAHDEGHLFQTTGLVMDRLVPADNPDHRIPRGRSTRHSLRVRLEGDAALMQPYADVLTALDEPHPIGGERRLARWIADASTTAAGSSAISGWNCPKLLRDALAKVPTSGLRGVRMLLASPAIFEHGWLPGWLAPSDQGGWTGTPPGLQPSDIVLRLIAARVERWMPVSGWFHEDGKWGPKPVRRMTPAGSVYFFHVESGDPACLADRWLEPVGDHQTDSNQEPGQDGRDGFGLAVWGVWQPHNSSHTFGV